jgi:hypothetical protein
MRSRGVSSTRQSPRIRYSRVAQSMPWVHDGLVEVGWPSTPSWGLSRQRVMHTMNRRLVHAKLPPLGKWKSSQQLAWVLGGIVDVTGSHRRRGCGTRAKGLPNCVGSNGLAIGG